MTSSKQILSFISFSILLRRALFILLLTLAVVNQGQAQALNQSSNQTPESEVSESPASNKPNTPERRRVRNVRTTDYPIPMRFDVIGDGVEVKSLMLDYDLAESGGKSLRMGNIHFDDSSFYAALMPANRLDTKLAQLLPKSAEREWIFVLTWPTNLVTDGNLEVISRTGRVLWSQQIGKKEIEEWASQQQQWRETLIAAKFSNEEIQNSPVFKTSFGIRDAKNKDVPFWNLEESFRFCLTSSKGAGQTRLCTAQYQVRKNKDQIKFEFVPKSPTPARVILYNEAGPLTKYEEVKIGKPVQFYAELSTGASYEFFSIPLALQLVEMTEVKGTQRVFVVGEGEFPLQKIRVVREEYVSSFTEMLGWQQTIGELKRYWEAEINREQSFIMIPGDGGGAFKQEFVITKLPREEIRPYMKRRTINSTYVDGAKIFLQKQRSLLASSEMNSAEQDEDDKSKVTWRFGATERGQYNRSHLLLTEGDTTYKAYYELYKGYPREISARMTGILGSGNNFILMSEVAFNYWFEDIFGWTQYYLSRQRWGFSGKYFKSLTPIKIATTNSGPLSSNLESITAELKYRLEPGLWNRDESWGLLAGFQRVSYEQFEADMLGAGIFWARSMPKVFDEFLNRAKFMRYPKWVDMEFIYYLKGMAADSQLRSPFSNSGSIGNWSLNFHGKVLWGKNVFGEAGFGIKQYDFNKVFTSGAIRSLNFKFTSFYGTVGMGVSF